jgi:predicted nucleic acid-binding protein
MTIAIDTSVLVAAIVATENHHEACNRLFDRKDLSLYAHGLAETFSTLTGGRRAFRMTPSMAASVIEEDYLPCLTIANLSPTQMLRAMREAESRGVRGGALFDYLHLAAARQARATQLYTLNLSHFRSFYREGDPEIVHPEEV